MIVENRVKNEGFHKLAELENGSAMIDSDIMDCLSFNKFLLRGRREHMRSKDWGFRPRTRLCNASSVSAQARITQSIPHLTRKRDAINAETVQ